MVLTEAFAAGTPVIASEIAGYSDVVDRRRRRRPDPARRPAAARRGAPAAPPRAGPPARRWARPPARSAERFAWPRVAARIERVYERAIDAARAAADAVARVLARAGIVAADGLPRVPAERLPSPDPTPAADDRFAAPAGSPAGPASRSPAAVGVGLTLLAAHRIGIDSVVESAVRSDFAWVLVATALMCAVDVLPRRRLASGRPRRAAGREPAPPRLHLGDDDRRADVGDAAGPPRRAGPRDDHLAADRPLPRDLPGPARDARLADGPQHRRAGPARRRSSSPRPTSSIATPSTSSSSRWLRRSCWSRSPPRRRSSAAPASGRVARLAGMARDALVRVRSGLAVFRDPRRGPLAAALQLFAWAIQVAACYALAVAMGLDGDDGDRRRRGGPVRGQRHRRRSRHALQHRRLPARRDQRSHHRLRRRRRRRPRLRRDPPGGRDRDRRRPRPAGPRPRGHELVGRPPPRAQRGARCACSRKQRAEEPVREGVLGRDADATLSVAAGIPWQATIQSG